MRKEALRWWKKNSREKDKFINSRWGNLWFLKIASLTNHFFEADLVSVALKKMFCKERKHLLSGSDNEFGSSYRIRSRKWSLWASCISFVSRPSSPSPQVELLSKTSHSVIDSARRWYFLINPALPLESREQIVCTTSSPCAHRIFRWLVKCKIDGNTNGNGKKFCSRSGT